MPAILFKTWLISHVPFNLRNFELALYSRLILVEICLFITSPTHRCLPKITKFSSQVDGIADTDF